MVHGLRCLHPAGDVAKLSPPGVLVVWVWQACRATHTGQHEVFPVSHANSLYHAEIPLAWKAHLHVRTARGGGGHLHWPLQPDTACVLYRSPVVRLTSTPYVKSESIRGFAVRARREPLFRMHSANQTPTGPTRLPRATRNTHNNLMFGERAAGNCY